MLWRRCDSYNNIHITNDPKWVKKTIIQIILGHRVTEVSNVADYRLPRHEFNLQLRNEGCFIFSYIGYVMNLLNPVPRPDAKPQQFHEIYHVWSIVTWQWNNNTISAWACLYLWYLENQSVLRFWYVVLERQDIRLKYYIYLKS